MKRTLFAAGICLVLGGCVSAVKYKSAVEETQASQSKAAALEAENAALRADHAAKMQEAQVKAEGLEKQIKELSEQASSMQKTQTDLAQELKDVKKVGELLKGDNGRLEKLLQDRKAEYAKVSAKLKGSLDAMRGAVDEADQALK